VEDLDDLPPATTIDGGVDLPTNIKFTQKIVYIKSILNMYNYHCIVH